LRRTSQDAELGPVIRLVDQAPSAPESGSTSGTGRQATTGLLLTAHNSVDRWRAAACDSANRPRPAACHSTDRWCGTAHGPAKRPPDGARPGGQAAPGGVPPGRTGGAGRCATRWTGGARRRTARQTGGAGRRATSVRLGDRHGQPTGTLGHRYRRQQQHQAAGTAATPTPTAAGGPGQAFKHNIRLGPSGRALRFARLGVESGKAGRSATETGKVP